jgi:FkbM family methyltransferase
VTPEAALAQLGTDPGARAGVVAALHAYEAAHPFSKARDEVTGPIADALHPHGVVLTKELSSGLVLEFPYRSKIARDFVLSIPERPDHVWEPQTTKLLLALAHHDAVIGGAYFGDQAVLVAWVLGDRGSCHAFEPNHEQAAALVRNARRNGLDNLRIHTTALWRDGRSHLRFVGEDAYARTEAADTGIPTATIDDTVTAEVGLIVLDLEGGELPALQGATRVLHDDRPNVVFEVHRSYVDWSEGLASTEAAAFLLALGYELFAIRDFQSNVDLAGRPVELVPIETAYLDGPPHGFNLLAVHDLTAIEGCSIVPHVSPKLLRHGDPRLHHPVGGL